jgi:hypothetical protein
MYDRDEKERWIVIARVVGADVVSTGRISGLRF